MSIVTCIAPVNIAVIKYWGKRDEDLILPINDSISLSLDTQQLCTKTTVMASPNFKENKIWLNGREESINNKRLQNCLEKIKSKATLTNEMEMWKVHICSNNNFPTAAGLASSAAGYACLTAALAKLYNFTGDISEIARTGSGSACRSVFGGFVRWYMGSDPTGVDSIAKQIAPASHWPEMRIIILVVNDVSKKIPSAVGMKTSVQTSELIKYRAEVCVPKRVELMQKAIIQKNFKQFAELTMRDSNQMHAVCLDTYPPCNYLTDTSHAIIDLISSYNDASNSIKVAYTNDAGPNTVLYLLEENVPHVLGLIDYFFPPNETSNNNYKRGNPPASISPSKDLLEKLNCKKQQEGSIKYIIHTRVGEGPTYLDDPSEHLLNNSGLPKDL
ncbi:diphosphomevalonate decarboxylase [Microplitis mediator]|uniref:diphosphomevalonate decarboxylase n=1 Tax=Microplitis mediator TaxID=375433 RepID=UPI002553091B|nr:diphosphomevalonate decarboxylase [Microplitis mediator]